MPRPIRWLFGTLIVTLLIGGPLAYHSFRHRNFRNFHVVKPDVLYRSGQLSPLGLQEILHDYQIKTIITLRDSSVPGQPPPDLAEEEYCRAQGINHYRLPPREWERRGKVAAPADANVRKIIEIMDDPKNYPVLIHCFAGSHRTGAYVAVYRMEYEGWSNRQALEEMKAYGYDKLDEEWDILGYLESYRTRAQRQAGVEEAEPGTDQ